MPDEYRIRRYVSRNNVKQFQECDALTAIVGQAVWKYDHKVVVDIKTDVYDDQSKRWSRVTSLASIWATRKNRITDTPAAELGRKIMLDISKTRVSEANTVDTRTWRVKKRALPWGELEIKALGKRIKRDPDMSPRDTVSVERIGNNAYKCIVRSKIQEHDRDAIKKFNSEGKERVIDSPWGEEVILYVCYLDEPIPAKKVQPIDHIVSVMKLLQKPISRVKNKVPVPSGDLIVDLPHYDYLPHLHLLPDSVPLLTTEDGIAVVTGVERSLICRSCRRAENVCCKRKADFKPLKRPELSTKGVEYRTIVYDIESSQNDKGEHKLEMVSYSNPFMPGELQTVYSAEAFISFIWECVGCLPKDQAICLIVAGYNSSRYDDLFITPAYRRSIAARGLLASYKYGSKQGAAIFNNVMVNESISIKFVDALRFVAAPLPLALAAKAFNVPVSKGSFPFEALNEMGRGVQPEHEGTTYALRYFKGDVKAQQDTAEFLAMAARMNPKTEQDRSDAWYHCRLYCEQDVEVTRQVLDALNELLTGMYHAPQKHMFAFHGTPNLAYRVMVNSALDSTHEFVLRKQKLTTAVVTKDKEKSDRRKGDKEHYLRLTVPKNEMYKYCNSAIAGGWVNSAILGVLLHSGTVKKLGLDHKDMDAYLMQHGPQFSRLHYTKVKKIMVDIVSHYPSSVSCPMPCGRPEFVADQEQLHHLVDILLQETDPANLPMFIMKCRMKIPKKPTAQLSCLPLRGPPQGNKRPLLWTYDQAAASAWGYYTSVDLWNACKRFAYTPEQGWTIDEIESAVVWEFGAPIYAKYMAMAKELKEKGTREKNIGLRTIAKILLNSAIGTLGRKCETREFVPKANLHTFIQEHGDHARCIGDAMGGDSVWLNSDFSSNTFPIHHAAFMYAWSRTILRDMLEVSCDGMNKNLFTDADEPTPDYGDTDSLIIPEKKLKQRNPTHRMQSEIGIYNGAVQYNFEPEDIHTPGFEFFGLIVLARKFYCLITCNPETKEFKYKFKSKGHKVWKPQLGCFDHVTINCPKCTCEHGEFKLMCAACICLDLPSVAAADPCTNAHSLCLYEFVRVALTGVPGTVYQMRFNRTLELPTMTKDAFTVSTNDQPMTVKYATLKGTRQGFWYRPIV